MKVSVVTDSSVYMSDALAAELDVRRVPLSITLGGETMPESSVEPKAFYARLRDTGERPTTSQPSPGDFLAAFTAARDAGAEAVLCITCASVISGTHQSATLAAGMAEVPVDVVDSGTISGGLLLVVGDVARAVRDGASRADALALAQSMAGRVWSTFATDSLKLLAAGGRLAEDAAEADGVPVLAMEGQAIRSLGSARSIDDAVRWQAEVIAESAALSPTRVTVGHGDVVDLADALEAALTGRPGVLGIDRYVVGPAVGAHAGAGNFGASYLSPPET
ncbi:MAG TPA: DegV family protein [Mycobacteriales bacterium]|nr:DegV family protein [Mycobacteriales bacterium]